MEDKFELTELMLVRAWDWIRTFVGVQKEIGDNLYLGNVIVNEGEIISIAKSEKELMSNLNDMCVLKLDHGLHGIDGKYKKMSGFKIYIN